MICRLATAIHATSTLTVRYIRNKTVLQLTVENSRIRTRNQDARGLNRASAANSCQIWISLRWRSRASSVRPR